MPGVRYRFENIEVDPAQRTVLRDGVADRPRQRVFDLLVYFLANPDRVISKQELVDRVWGEVAITDSVLYKTILEARRALGEDGERLIRTLPKAGYQFTACVDEIGAHPAESPEPTVAPVAVAALASVAKPWLRTAAIVTALVAFAAGGGWIYLARAGGRPTPLIEGEIAWWRLDEGGGNSVKDSAGENHGRLIAGPAWARVPQRVAGRLGRALHFDGGGGYVEGGLSLPDWTPLTFSAWVKLPAAQGTVQPIFDSPRFRFHLDAHGVPIVGRPAPAFGSPGRIDDGRWHFIAAVDEGPMTDTGRLFIDGEETASSAMWPLGKPSGSRWRIGQSLTGGAVLTGDVDDVRIFARPLRQQEIAALFEAGRERADVRVSGQSGYSFVPAWAGAVPYADGSFANRGRDFGGIQLARLDPETPLRRMQGADLGPDLRIGVDLLLPAADGLQTAGGPYVRNRLGYAGDGLAGGTASGYWVKLESSGVVSVWQWNPYHAIAEANAPAAWDAGRYHRLETSAQGTSLEVWLDGSPVEFESDSRRSTRIEIVPGSRRHGSAE